MKKIDKCFIMLMVMLFLLQLPVFAQDPDKKFEQYKKGFISELWHHFPEWATSVGYHQYDDRLNIMNDSGRNAIQKFAGTQLGKLQELKQSGLSVDNDIARQMINNEMEKILWQINEEQAWKWNPAMYNVSDAFAKILYENYATLSERVTSFYERAKLVPAYYTAAKKNIQDPVPELQQLAMDQNEGGLDIFRVDFLDSLQKLPISAKRKEEMKHVVLEATAAVQDYVDFLNRLQPKNPRSFRLGQKMYSRKFAYDIQSQYSADELYQLALKRKQFVHSEMAKLSRQLWPKYFGNRQMPTGDLQLIRAMIDTLSVRHVRPEEFQTAIEKQLPELVKFINDKNLLYLDPSKPLVIRKEPAYMAGVAGASISSPGPYEADGNTYYNVGSLEGWPVEKSESYLREYNHYILQILNIHEAIPGHYTQLIYSNKSPDIIKSILGNGSMVEGWAVYTEQMMLENGYGNNDPEMWLMWYKWNLRTVCNTILDYSVHTQNMSKEAAIRLLTEEAFQQQAEAEGKWKRVSVTSVQLTSYFNGYTEIVQLREDYRNQKGNTYNLKAFNEQFLSYGSAPVKYIRRQMIKD